MAGLDRATGGSLSGWDHVVQSLQVIFTTAFHERVMRRYFGSMVPMMLGQNMVERVILRFFYSVVVAIELWEPRFRVVSVDINNATRLGEIGFTIQGIYYPNAHLEDFSTEKRRTLIMIAQQSGVTVSNSFETGVAA